MKKRFSAGNRVLSISICTVCTIIFLANCTFGLGYYGTHHGHNGHGRHNYNHRHQGAHHSNFQHFSGHHSSFGHRGGHHSHGRHNRHYGNRLHSSLYNHNSRGSYGHYKYRNHNNYGHYNDHVNNNNCISSLPPIIIINQGASYAPNSSIHDYVNEYAVHENSREEEYTHKEPYIFVYGEDYIPGSDAYVFQYEQDKKENSSLYAENRTK